MADRKFVSSIDNEIKQIKLYEEADKFPIYSYKEKSNTMKKLVLLIKALLIWIKSSYIMVVGAVKLNFAILLEVQLTLFM